jgi:DNA recombination protein RmuC
MFIAPTVLLVALVAVAIGVALGWLAGRPIQARLRHELEGVHALHGEQLARERALHDERLEQALEKERAVHAERLKAYQDAEVKLREAFQALSAEALKTNNEAFLALAETRLRDARNEAAVDIDGRRQAIENLLAPMAKTLEQVDRDMRDSERRRIEEGAHLIQKIASIDAMGQDLRTQTARLVDALKRPGVRGRWGELQLKRVVEVAGMIEHCHFTEQQTINGDEGRLRPDLIVQLPGGKQVIVDAKVPLDAYLRALEAQDDEVRQRLLVEHARQVRVHMSQLSAKNYAAQVPVSPDFVVMFLPGEMFFSAALEQDPTLIEFGVDKHVIPASPTTLIALLRAVAYGWQQEAVARDARQIAEAGRKLYDAVGKLAEHVDRLGGRLRSSIEAYNDAIGSLEGNVLVKARKFKELQATNGAEDVRTLEPIDRVPRMLQAPELTHGLPFQEEEEELEKV